MENLQLALMNAAMCGGAVSVAAVAVILLWPQLAGACRAVRKRPVWERVLIAWFIAALIAYGGSKSGGGTNEVENGEAVSRPLQMVGNRPLPKRGFQGGFSQGTDGRWTELAVVRIRTGGLDDWSGRFR